MPEETPVQFPAYEPPQPRGVPVADAKYHKPLFKLLRQLLQPRKKMLTRRPKTRTKKARFY